MMRLMRGIILSIVLTTMTAMALSGLSNMTNVRASASKANSPLLAQGLGNVSINDASVTEGDAGETRIRGLDAMAGRANYFIGDRPKWRTSVPSYARVECKDIYDGIDLIYYGNHRQLEYDFIVAPGADPASIRLRFDGAESLQIESDGDLVLQTAGREVRQRKPVAYQAVDGVRRIVPVRYLLNDVKHGIGHPSNCVGRLPPVTLQVGSYDHSRPLIIDPVLAFSTYFGGAGNEEGNSIAVDSAGNVYLTGFSDSINFPSVNAAQSNIAGGQQDAFVVKLDPSGTRVMYSERSPGETRWRRVRRLRREAESVRLSSNLFHLPRRHR